MLSQIECFRRAVSWSACASLASGLLAACAAPVAPSRPPAGLSSAIAKLPVVIDPVHAPVSLPVLVQDAVAPILIYADRIKPLQGAELVLEIARFADQPTPAEQIMLALALVQTRQLNDLARAQETLQRVLFNTSSDARLLYPLVRMLSGRFAEQRRVEDQLDRQGAQLRDVQRRLEQTNDKLEALKEIERSLSRPGASAAAEPLNRNRRKTLTP